MRQVRFNWKCNSVLFHDDFRTVCCCMTILDVTILKFLLQNYQGSIMSKNLPTSTDLTYTFLHLLWFLISEFFTPFLELREFSYMDITGVVKHTGAPVYNMVDRDRWTWTIGVLRLEVQPIFFSKNLHYW